MICVVEDDPNIREIEVYAMKDCHMETKEASCAKEFWKLCENEVQCRITKAGSAIRQIFRLSKKCGKMQGFPMFL